MVVRKQAEIKVTAKTDQAAQQFAMLSASQDRAAESLNKYVEAARKQNDIDRLASFDKSVTQLQKREAVTRSLAMSTGGLAEKLGLGAGAATAFGSAIKQVETGQMSLKQGVMSVAAAFGPLGIAVGLAGSALVGFVQHQREAADAADEVTKALEKQRRALALEREDKARAAREEAYHIRVDKEFWSARQRAVDEYADELKGIENTLAQHGRGRDMSAYIAREAEIRAHSAETMGRYEEAAQIRREEELRLLGEIGEKDRQRGKQKREEARWSAEITNQIRMQHALITREGSDSRDFAAEMRAAKAGEVRQSFVEHRKQQQIDAMSEEIRGQESMLEIKLQGIERERAAGVDPWSLAQQEADAKLFALEAHQRYVDETMVGQERLIASEQIAAQKRQVMHERDLQMIAAIQRRREQQRRAFEQIGGAIGRVHEGIAAAAIRGAFASGQSVKDSVRHFAAGEAAEMSITAATETIRGLVAIASYNFPKATQHFTNAGLAGAQAISLGALYGVTAGNGRSVHKGSGLAPATGANFGLAPSNGDGGGMSSRSGSIGQGPPISRPTSSATPPPRAGGPRRDGAAPVINIYSLTGPDSAQMTELRRALKHSERDDGDVN